MINKKLTVGLLLASVFLALPAPVFATGCPVTISITDTVSSRAIGDTANVEQRLAQTFTAPCTGSFSSFQVRFGASNGSPAGDITWELRGESLGAPGALIQTGTFAPTASTVMTVTPAAGITLSEGAQYWLILFAPNQATDARYTWSGSSASTYAGGSAYFSTNAGSTWTLLSADSYFVITVGPITATNTPASTSTPSDTATPTITPSPTPNYLIEVTATSGAPMALERTATYGDLATFGGLLIVAGVLFFIFVYTYWRDRARAGIDS